MAAPPRTKSISAEAFDGAPDWFTQTFLPVINDHFRDTINALSRQLTLSENIASKSIADLRVDVGASYAADVAPFPLLLASGFKVAHLIITKSNALDGSAFSTPVFPTWENTGDGRVKIRFLTGLAVSKSYRFSFLFLPE